MQSRSREQLGEDRQNFFENTTKMTPQTQKSGYTREYSYNIDSKDLQHPGQSDPRGLGFSYDKPNSATTGTKMSRDSPVQRGTAVSFTYDPHISSNIDTNRYETKEAFSTKKIEELKYGNARTAQKEVRLSDQTDRHSSGDMRSRTPEAKIGKGPTNIDESSEISSTSHESMVGEYAKESMRQKTSAFIASSGGNSTTPKTSSIYKSPITQTFKQANQSHSSAKTSEPVGRTRQQQQPSERQRSLWDQESSSPIGRQPILTASQVEEVDRKYAELARSRTSLSSTNEDSRVVPTKTHSSSVVMILPVLVY